MCSCYIGTDVSSLVPVCPEQLLDTKFCRSIGTSECRNIGMSEHRNVGVSECRNIGIPEYWVRNPGKARFRPFGSRYTSARCSEVLIIPVLQGSDVLIAPTFRGSEVLSFFSELWRVPDAELYLRQTLILNFVLECVVIPWYPIDPLSVYLFWFENFVFAR